MKTAIRYTREDNYPLWYLEVVKEADLAENSNVRGCMVFKPWGFALWERIKEELDHMIKETGHQNVYFPLFIPLSGLQKEADHVEGFATECAVVTHHRLEKNEDGELTPAGELEEPLIVRPTSEIIVGDSFSKWIESYRDLPVLINQWANVVRWEMRTRPFLRTAEFLWQEGHTAHATREEAEEETMKMLEVYRVLCEDYMAMPLILGKKSESEKFPGAEDTYSIEAMMHNRKALQSGTSHYLGQNFAKASDITFADDNGEQQHVHTTSWGVSTRLIGGLIMTHSDDNGLVLPPKIAPTQVVILPIFKGDEDRAKVEAYLEEITTSLKAQNIRYHIDWRDMRGGQKNWHWIKKGVPLKIEVGPRDIEKNSLAVMRRDDPELKKEFIPKDQFLSEVQNTLEDIQTTLFNRAKTHLAEHSREITDKQEFETFFTPKNKDNPEIHGGFAYSPWCGDADCEDQINKDLSVTIRNIPLNSKKPTGKTCVYCEKEACHEVVFAKAY